MAEKKKRFKLTFRGTEVQKPNGEMQRAVIIGVAPSPVKGWLNAVLACEDSSLRQTVISQQDFDLSAKKEIVMLEVEDEEAPPVIYTPQGLG